MSLGAVAPLRASSSSIRGLRPVRCTRVGAAGDYCPVRILFNRLRQALAARLWAWPLLAGVVAALAASILGRVVVPAEGALAQWLWPGDTEAAASMLSFIASTTLTVLTTTISMTLIVIQVSAGNFSHQLPRDFISSPAVRGIISVYVGVFIYALLLLRSLDTSVKRPPQLAITLSMVLVVAAVATFIWYVSRVVTMVRADSIIAASARRVVTRARATFKEDGQAVARPQVPADAQLLRAGQFGYVQQVDLEHAASWAKEHDGTVVINVCPGDVVLAGDVLAHYWSAENDELPAVVYLAMERVSGADYSLGLQQLFDIAVRALSPGTNDPTTARHAVLQAAAVLQELTELPMVPHTRFADERLTVWARVRDQRYLVHEFVRGVRRYAGGEPDVLVALLRLLSVVGDSDDPQLQQAVEKEREKLLAVAEANLDDVDEFARVRQAATW